MLKSCCICKETLKSTSWLQRAVQIFTKRGADSEPWDVLPCNHVACHRCMRLWIEELARNRWMHSLSCPWMNCNEIVETKHVVSLGLSLEALAFVNDATKRRSTLKQSTPSSEFEDPVVKYNRGGSKTKLPELELTSDDWLFMHLAKTAWKYQRCPHCGIFTELRSGCCTLTCRNCMKAWRWNRCLN